MRVLANTKGVAQVPVMQGTLSKLRPKSGLSKVVEIWQKRFFVLCADRLLYFKNYAAFKDGKDALGVIPLQHAWLLCDVGNIQGLHFVIR